MCICVCELESRDILERLMSSSFGVYENRIHFYQFLKMDYWIYVYIFFFCWKIEKCFIRQLVLDRMKNSGLLFFERIR